eukprot:gene2084-2362_t
MDQDKEMVGYVHDVSYIGKGEEKKFFDFQFQTETGVVRAVCFSPGKKRCFEEASFKKSPVKIKKFMKDKAAHSTDIIMNEKVIVQELPSLNFECHDLVPKELNIQKLAEVSPQQMVTLKAKVCNLRKETTILQYSKNPLKKRDGLLVDPFGNIKIVFWEDDINAVEEGKTYVFKNLRVKKNKMRSDMYVNPAKGCCTITPAVEFEEDLQYPQTLPQEMITATVTGEIIGIQKCVLNFCCFKCSKVIPDCSGSTLVQCKHCHMKQKTKNCNKQWYMNAVVGDEDKKVSLNFYHDIVITLLGIVKPDADVHDEEEASDLFFSMSSITCLYNESTRAVQSVDI